MVTYTFGSKDEVTLRESLVIAEATIVAGTNEDLKERFRDLRRLVFSEEAPPKPVEVLFCNSGLPITP